MNEHHEVLVQEFRDKTYRHSYGQEYVVDTIATQIKVLREDRNLTQEQLAELAKMKQARISLMECGDYSGWSLRTLHRLAEAFDVALMVRFEPFSRLIELVETTSRENLSVKSFDMELPVLTNKAAATQGMVWSAPGGEKFSVTMSNAVTLNCGSLAAYNVIIGPTLSDQIECNYRCIELKTPSQKPDMSEAA